MKGNEGEYVGKILAAQIEDASKIDAKSPIQQYAYFALQGLQRDNNRAIEAKKAVRNADKTNSSSSNDDPSESTNNSNEGNIVPLGCAGSVIPKNELGSEDFDNNHS